MWHHNEAVSLPCLVTFCKIKITSWIPFYDKHHICNNWLERQRIAIFSILTKFLVVYCVYHVNANSVNHKVHLPGCWESWCNDQNDDVPLWKLCTAAPVEMHSCMKHEKHHNTTSNQLSRLFNQTITCVDSFYLCTHRQINGWVDGWNSWMDGLRDE